jgi:hypothetical protein
MKLAQLKKIPVTDAHERAAADARFRGTPLTTRAPLWRRHRVAIALGGAPLVLLLLGLAFRGWLGTEAGAFTGARARTGALRGGRFRHAVPR